MTVACQYLDRLWDLVADCGWELGPLVGTSQVALALDRPGHAKLVKRGASLNEAAREILVALGEAAKS